MNEPEVATAEQHPHEELKPTSHSLVSDRHSLLLDLLIEEFYQRENRSTSSASEIESLLKTLRAIRKTTEQLTLADDILRIAPDHAETLLCRGQIHLLNGHSLKALADFYRVITFTQNKGMIVTARLAAAGILEQQGDYQAATEALGELTSADAIRLRKRLKNKALGNPFVLIKQSDHMVMHDTLQLNPVETVYHGYFAVEIKATGSATQMNADSWKQRILSASYAFVEILGGLRHSPGYPVLAIRIIAEKGDSSTSTNRLSIALVTHVIGYDQNSCRDYSVKLWHAISAMLPDRGKAYLYQPVMSEQRLEHFLKPFEIANVSEIVRREESRDSENTYAIYPFTPGWIDMHSVCHALLNNPGPALVSLHLLPTTLMPWEHATLDRMMTAKDKSNTDNRYKTELLQPIDDPVAHWWQNVSRHEQAQVNRHMIDYLRTNAYVLNVNVASTSGSNPLLPTQIASAMFGVPRLVEGMMFGGYDISSATTDTEFEMAIHNVVNVDVDNWVHTNAPNGGERLRHLVTQGEAVNVFRFPIPGTDGVPGLDINRIKPLAPSTTLPSEGIILGESVASSNGNKKPIVQHVNDRRRHTYVVGKTGTGKSTLLLNLVLQDIGQGHGVCVVDPHGDLIEDILPRIPLTRGADVVLFDAAEEQYPIGINILDAKSEADKHIIVNEFIALLTMLYDPQNTGGIVGPRFQHNVRNAMLTAMSVKGNTLMQVVRVLTDIQYVKSILDQVDDPVVKSYWTKQIAQTSDFHKSEILDYIVSKFSRFVGDQRVRNIIGQKYNTIDFRHIMDHRQILLVKLSKGKLGEENAYFLGQLLMQKLLINVLSRAELPSHQRPDFMLYVDEFQNFATPLFATILSEGRKYGVAATIANQYLTQLSMPIKEAIFGNVGTIISFLLGTKDAEVLASEMAPVFSQDDLINMPKFTAGVKLLVNGVAARPFSMQTLPDLRMPDLVLGEAIREMSRRVYGRDVNEISSEILKAYGIDVAE